MREEAVDGNQDGNHSRIVLYTLEFRLDCM
jgi:hypothetical protein